MTLLVHCLLGTAAISQACLQSDASCADDQLSEGDQPALVQLRLNSRVAEDRGQRGGSEAFATKKVWANTEWERLREVIVGGAGQIFPGNSFTWKGGAAAILPGKDFSLVTQCIGDDARTSWDCCTGTPGVDEDPGCPAPNTPTELADPCCTYGRVEKEAKELADMLSRSGVIVHRVTDRLTVGKAINNWGNFSVGPLGSGAMDIFPRDTQQVIENLLIETDLGAPNRRGEILSESTLFKQRLKESDVVHFAMPQHSFEDVAHWKDKNKNIGLYNKHEHPVIEGGDVMLLGDTILIGVSDNQYQGSSVLGVEWLQQTLNNMHIKKNVIAVPLDQRVLHLDLVMSFPKEGLVVVADLPSPVDGAGAVLPETERNTTKNGKWLAFPEGLPAVLNNYTKVRVSGLAGMYMATNAIPVNQSFIIMANNSQAPPEIQKEFAGAQEALQQKGLTVETIDFWAHALYGGAMRCSTHPLQRWD